MTTSPTPGTVLFQDSFTGTGTLNPSNWDYNQNINGSAFIGQTWFRQAMVTQNDGAAQIVLDTWGANNTAGKVGGGPDNTPKNFNVFIGSEAVTKSSDGSKPNFGAWLATEQNGIAFEGTFKFPSKQGGMITGFFLYQATPPGEGEKHDELDFEILTTELGRISTNVFSKDAPSIIINGNSHVDRPQSLPTAQDTPSTLPAGFFESYHNYRIEWYHDSILWFLDGKLIRTVSEADLIPRSEMRFHMNLWGVPGGPPQPNPWGVNDGDPTGPTVGSAGFVPVFNQSNNVTYTFNVSHVKVEQLPAKPGTNAHDVVNGAASAEHLSGLAGDDNLNGLGGDDTFVGAHGHDALNGGDGSDTAIFSGERSDYTVSAVGAATIISDTRADTPDGTDTLTGVEFASFADGLYAIGAGGVLTLAPIVFQASSNFVERFVQADAYVVKQGQALTVGAAAGVLSDDGGSSLTASLVNGPLHGTLNLASDGNVHLHADRRLPGFRQLHLSRLGQRRRNRRN
ncbi:MAG: family 16 glycosylhydrolase [Reyranella sp.]|uniref:family 16 glycosylhydrolase n=1 Tax=Reyranella sp. TaxID=1929291 RepID=UPI003D0AC393